VKIFLAGLSASCVKLLDLSQPRSIFFWIQFLLTIWCDICGARIIFPLHKFPARGPSSSAGLFCLYCQEFSPLGFNCAIRDFCSQSLPRPAQIRFGRRVFL
jgi:hypothetical protein